MKIVNINWKGKTGAQHFTYFVMISNNLAFSQDSWFRIFLSFSIKYCSRIFEFWYIAECSLGWKPFKIGVYFLRRLNKIRNCHDGIWSVAYGGLRSKNNHRLNKIRRRSWKKIHDLANCGIWSTKIVFSLFSYFFHLSSFSHSHPSKTKNY